MGRNSFAFASLVVLACQAHAQSTKTADRSVFTPASALPYMTVRIERAPDPELTDAAANAGSKVGGYTRLIMEYIEGDGSTATEPVTDADRRRERAMSARRYRSERRNPFTRWLAGKSITRVLTVKSSLIRPKLTTQMLAASVERQSSSKAGESWTTEFNGDRHLTPLFRIDPDTTITVETALSLSSSYDATAAKAILDVVRRGAALVAPAATLVTPLSQKRYDDASDFIDNSLRSLMRESITERGSNDFSLARMAGGPLLQVTLEVPMGNKITPKSDANDGTQPRLLGTWLIRSAPATLSVFSDTPWPTTPRVRRKEGEECGGNDPQLRQACAAFARLDPQTVLNFAVDDNVTVGQALAGEQAIVTARDALVKAKKETVPAAAGAVCALVTDKAQKLGFNRYDIAAVAWAYASNSTLTDNVNALRDPNNCAPLKIAYAVGLPRGEFAAEGSPEEEGASIADM